MRLYSEEMIKAYQTRDEDDPYGDLDSIYKEVYENYKKQENGYTDEFYFAKVNDEIVGITSGVYDNEIYGIYGLAVKKDFRFKRANPNKWGICGEKVDLGEIPLDAGIRETLEEIGILLNKEELKFLSMDTNEKSHFTVYYARKNVDVNIALNKFKL